MTLEPLLGSTAIYQADVSWITSSELSSYGLTNLVRFGAEKFSDLYRAPGISTWGKLGKPSEANWKPPPHLLLYYYPA